MVMLAALLTACRKNQPACTANCADISISGKVYIKTNNAALAKVPVEVNWFRKGYCIGCTSYKVASVQTNTEGEFHLNTTIDSSFFEDYFLSVRVPGDTNFIAEPNMGGIHFSEVRFDDFDPGQFKDIHFEYYPKTYLTIRLHRTHSDDFDYFSVDHNFTSSFGYGDYIITGPQLAKDTSLMVETSADVYTRIIWKKTVVGGTSIEQTDSLVCTGNGPNVYDINF